jgi:hypothetical protein
MELAESLRAGLQELFASDTLELREDGGRLTLARLLSWEVRGATEKPLLHVWAENCNMTRRVVAIADRSGDRLILTVERFGRARPSRLEIVRLNFQRSAKEISREGFCEQLRRILAEQFPDETVERLSASADLEHSLSCVYARGIARKGATKCAFLAVPDGESADAIESSLTYALLWLERARQSAGNGHLSWLRLILPKGRASALAHRLRVLDSRLAIQVCELNPLNESIERVNPCADGNVCHWLVPHREAEFLKSRAQAALAPIIAMEPEAITAHAAPQEQEVVLRFRGLPFAKWSN